MSLDLTILDEQPHLIAQNMTFAGAAVNGKWIGVLLSDGSLQRLDLDGAPYGPPIPGLSRRVYGNQVVPVGLAVCGDAFIALGLAYDVLVVRKIGLGEAAFPLSLSGTGTYLDRAVIASNGTSSLIVLGTPNYGNNSDPSVRAIEVRSTGAVPEFVGKLKVVDPAIGYEGSEFGCRG